MRIYDRTGQKIGVWTVIKMIASKGRKTYLLRCDCGNEKLVTSNHITRHIPCFPCNTKIEHNSHIGEKHGSITCQGYHKVKKGNGHGYLIQCDCGKKYTVDSYSQFKKNSSCRKCSHGMHPGKRVGQTVLIESMQNRQWKKRCECGIIFIGRASKNDCGCIYKKKLLEAALSKVGNKHQFLTIKKIIGHCNGHIQLLIRCKCGKEFVRNNGHEFKSKSCGCMLAVPVGEKSNSATLKNYEVRSMRELYETGMYSTKELSEMFSKPEKYIARILGRHIWKHV